MAADSDSMAGIDEVNALLQEVEEALRNLLQNVRPRSLETPGGLETTIRQRFGALSANGMATECVVDLPDEPPDEIKSVLHRQISEALVNVEKHAQATRVRLELKSENAGIYGAVTDNGTGFIVSERDRLPGHLGTAGAHGAAAARRRLGQDQERAGCGYDRRVLGSFTEVTTATPKQTRVLIVEDHQVVADGLGALINDTARHDSRGPGRLGRRVRGARE